MKFADIIALAWRNLRQARLRTSLTVIGVVVGVAAIVTMVSFGLGLQNNLLRDALARIDLFTSITVMGPGTDALLAMRDQSQDGAANDNGAGESNGEKSDGAVVVRRPILALIPHRQQGVGPRPHHSDRGEEVDPGQRVSQEVVLQAQPEADHLDDRRDADDYADDRQRGSQSGLPEIAPRERDDVGEVHTINP